MICKPNKQQVNPNPIAFLLVAAMLPVLLLCGCDRPNAHPKDSGQRAPNFSSNVLAYQVTGVLREIRANGSQALIKHEKIPGYMEAMTMQFDVRDTNELAGVQAGDQMTFRLLVTDTDAWIDRVKKSSATPEPESTVGLTVAEFKELTPGDPLPDCVLTNQLGQTIRLSDFKGRALAFTFIFTRCPLPTFCPRMNINLAAAQTALVAAKGPTNWHLLSISFDPEFDTPDRLAIYAKNYDQNTAHWSFATGATEAIRKLGNYFSLVFKPEGAVFSHNVRTVVVDSAGRVQKVFTGNEWQPTELVAEIEKAMNPKP